MNPLEMIDIRQQQMLNGITETTKYLELFLRNFILNENNLLSNQTLCIPLKKVV